MYDKLDQRMFASLSQKRISAEKLKNLKMFYLTYMISLSEFKNGEFFGARMGIFSE